MSLAKVRILENGIRLNPDWLYLISYQYPESIQNFLFISNASAPPTRHTEVALSKLLLGRWLILLPVWHVLPYLAFRNQRYYHLFPKLLLPPSLREPLDVSLPSLMLCLSLYGYHLSHGMVNICILRVRAAPWIWGVGGRHNAAHNRSFNIMCWLNSSLPGKVRSRLKEVVFRCIQTVLFAFASLACLFSWAPVIDKALYLGQEKCT